MNMRFMSNKFSSRNVQSPAKGDVWASYTLAYTPVKQEKSAFVTSLIYASALSATLFFNDYFSNVLNKK